MNKFITVKTARIRTLAFEMRCHRRLLNTSYKEHVTNEEVHGKSQAAIGEYDELLILVMKWKLRWCGHVSVSSGLAKTIIQQEQKKEEVDRKSGGKAIFKKKNGLCQLN